MAAERTKIFGIFWLSKVGAVVQELVRHPDRPLGVLSKKRTSKLEWGVYSSHVTLASQEALERFFAFFSSIPASSIYRPPAPVANRPAWRLRLCPHSPASDPQIIPFRGDHSIIRFLRLDQTKVSRHLRFRHEEILTADSFILIRIEYDGNAISRSISTLEATAQSLNVMVHLVCFFVSDQSSKMT